MKAILVAAFSLFFVVLLVVVLASCALSPILLALLDNDERKEAGITIDGRNEKHGNTDGHPVERKV